MYKRYNIKKDPIRVVTMSLRYCDLMLSDKKFKKSIIGIISTCNKNSHIPKSINFNRSFPLLDLRFNDIDDNFIVSSNTESDVSEFIVPNKNHIYSIIRFSKNIIKSNKNGIIACVSDNGIGRSTSCGIIVRSIIHGKNDRVAVIKSYQENESAVPNLRIIKLADIMLNKNGSLYRETVKIF